ncbi:hypothetical protein BGZ95_007663, partial [Linnemannia exigua]
MTKLFQLLLAAVFVSSASARFCMHVREATCDWGSCDYEFEGDRNGETLGSVFFFVPIGLPTDTFYMSTDNEWSYNPKQQRVRACGQEGALEET